MRLRLAHNLIHRSRFACSFHLARAASAKTPRAIVERLNREIIAAVNDPQIRQRFQELGVVENTSTPDGMRKRVINEIAKWNALIDKAKIPRL